jgi:hypothetical protein
VDLGALSSFSTSGLLTTWEMDPVRDLAEVGQSQVAEFNSQMDCEAESFFVAILKEVEIFTIPSMSLAVMESALIPVPVVILGFLKDITSNHVAATSDRKDASDNRRLPLIK